MSLSKLKRCRSHSQMIECNNNTSNDGSNKNDFDSNYAVLGLNGEQINSDCNDSII